MPRGVHVLQRVWVALSLVVSISSCDRDSVATQKMLDEKMAEKLDPISAKVAELEQKISSLQSTTTLQGWSIDAVTDSVATVATDGSGYGIARNQFGPFVVVANEPRPYLDGYKIALSVANLTSVRFNGAEIVVTWQSPFDPKNPKKDLGRQDKTFKVTDSFPPGMYANLDVALTPALPDQVKNISVGIKLDQVSIAGRKK